MDLKPQNFLKEIAEFCYWVPVPEKCGGCLPLYEENPNKK